MAVQERHSFGAPRRDVTASIHAAFRKPG